MKTIPNLLASFALVLLTLTAVSPAHADELPPCEHEDSVSCHWDATGQGNGEGASFRADTDGTVTPDPDEIPSTEEVQRQHMKDSVAELERREAIAEEWRQQQLDEFPTFAEEQEQFVKDSAAEVEQRNADNPGPGLPKAGN